MIKKKYSALLLFLIVCICAVSTVSASDLNATDDVVGEEANDEIAVNVNASDEIVKSENAGDDVLEASSMGTYTQLEKLLDSKSEVKLTKDYRYDADKDFLDVVFIEKDVSIYGNNHVIYTGEACSVFCIRENVEVEIYDLTFIFTEDRGIAARGAAIETDGDVYLQNCIFHGFKAQADGGAISNSGYLRINNCYFMNNSLSDKNAKGGAIYNSKELFVNGSYFGNNSADLGGAIYSEGDAWIQQSIFGTIIEENVIGPNKAIHGTSIYNRPGNICDINECYFNEATGQTPVEAITNVIASNSYFEDYSNVEGGVLNNCTTNQKTFSNTINSTGFTFTTTPSINTFYNSGENLLVTVTSSPGGERVANVGIEIIVDDDYNRPKYIITNSSGVATFKASTLSAGSHEIVVRLYDDLFGEQSATVPVTVKKATAEIAVSKLTTTYKSGKKWTIKLTDTSNGKPVSNMKITLKVYTGSKYKTYTVKTNSNGVATFKASNLDKGTHKVVLSISHNGYSCKSVTSSIKIKAKKLYIAGESNQFDNCGQLLLGAYDKEKEKLVSGIKLQIKIYTGKKYRTFNLVTKYSKAIGAVGVLIETNAFSTGSHKVTVTVKTPNYSGSESDKFVIPKSAKNYKKFTYVITNGKGKYV